MTTYNTYQEAKIANSGSAIFTNGQIFAIARSAKPLSLMKRCHPKDYCMTLEKFLADGYKLVTGDEWLDADGDVVRVKYIVNNKPNELDNERYILKAKALEDEFNDSEIADGSEWDGTGLPPVGVECEWINGGECGGGWGLAIVHAYANGYAWIEKMSDHSFHNAWDEPSYFRKPETPEEREEREHLEAAKDLWEKVKYEDDHDWGSISIWLQNYMLSIVRVTGYRKGTKS